MITTGFKGPLVLEDVWKLSQSNQTHYIANNLDSHLRNKKIQLNIIWSISRLFWKKLKLIALIKLIPSYLIFASPVILNELISFMEYGK
jgi:hypothetical protein